MKGAVTAPVAGHTITSFEVNAKSVHTFDIKFTVVWTATAEYVKKPTPPPEENVKAGTTGKVCGVVNYECIDFFIWVSVYNNLGECADGVWWIVLSDPATHKPVLKTRTDLKCEEKNDPPHEAPKDVPRKDGTQK